MSYALATLTEMYTDSEGEEHYVTTTHEEVELTPPPVVEKPKEKARLKSPPPPISEETVTVLSTSLVSTLVNYHDDTVIDDDEHTDKALNNASSPLNSDDDDVELPPEPQGRCSSELVEKLVRCHEKMTRTGMDMNQMIQKRKDFRNPSIYEKLIQFCNINEFGTNYPPEMYDPFKWGKSSYYDELAKVQKAEMDQREKERREKTKVEFLIGTAKKPSSASAGEEDIARRKSKWDQVGSTSTSIVKPPGLLPLTSTATGTKGTVISAFGSLNKKPRL